MLKFSSRSLPGALQLILPTDKTNPAFSIYLSKDERFLHVYYGLELLEVLPSDRAHPAYRLLVARLYNAGLRVQTLAEVFAIDPKTMRNWGRALLSSDPALLQHMLLGPEVARKRTCAIDTYVRQRWPALQREGIRNYREVLQQEIASLFGIKLSGETLRILMGEIKAGPCPAACSEIAEASAEAPENEVAQNPPLRDPICSEPAEPSGLPDAQPLPKALPISDAAPVSAECPAHAPAAPASKSTPCFWTPAPGATVFNNHAGLLLFADSLRSLANTLSPPEPLLAQWLGSILLGSANIEQTKYLNWPDLSLLLGTTVRFPTTQREGLQRLATPSTVDAVLRWNLAQLPASALGTDGHTDLYFDPHTVHYTGMQPVLKGWCANIRWADKLINSDYLHTTAGHPVYFECTDSYDDLRARFLPLIDRLRKSLQWAPERILTFIVDRGIYSNDLFTNVLAEPFVHFITWEKGYVSTPWDPAAQSGSFALEKVRNNSRDVKLYQFAWREGPWPANPKLRQIIVQATNPGGTIAQLAILTDDPDRPAAEIVRLMFSRWVQENDFKYLDKHFGINQLTSYRSIPYASLRATLTDRLVPSQLYREKAKAGKVILQQKNRLLGITDQAQRDENQRQQRLRELEAPPPGVAATEASAATAADVAGDAAAQSKERHRLKAASKRYQKYEQERSRKIDQLHEKLVANQADKDSLERDVSRLDQLVGADMVRMDTSNKTLMDAIKITARNLFYRALAPFKTAYNNYRDDHAYFRELTDSAGLLRWNGTEVEVHLVPQVDHAPKLQKVITNLLTEHNEKAPQLPDGSGRPLLLRLTSRTQIEVKVLDTPRL